MECPCPWVCDLETPISSATDNVNDEANTNLRNEDDKKNENITLDQIITKRSSRRLLSTTSETKYRQTLKLPLYFNGGRVTKVNIYQSHDLMHKL